MTEVQTMELDFTSPASIPSCHKSNLIRVHGGGAHPKATLVKTKPIKKAKRFQPIAQRHSFLRCSECRRLK